MSIRELLKGIQVSCDEDPQDVVNNIDVIDVPVEDFLATLVPTYRQYSALLTDDSGRVLKEAHSAIRTPMRPTDFVPYLKSLVSSFPANKRPSFCDVHKGDLQPLFKDKGNCYSTTLPDIAVSFPGSTLEPAPQALQWQRFSMVVEIKPRASQDPFDREYLSGPSISHLATCARNLMLANGFLAAFVLAIYGDRCRILRFDHACGLVSEAFSYLKRPDVLARLFWHFVHPCVGETVVGCDPTAHRLTPDDVAWTEAQLTSAKLESLSIDLGEGRRVDVHDSNNHLVRTFILLKPVSTYRRLFSRSTMVWLAIEALREGSVDGRRGRLAIVKEAWRELEIRSEAVVYERFRNVSEEERFGLSTLVCGVDLGEREVALWKAGNSSVSRGQEYAQSTIDVRSPLASVSMQELLPAASTSKDPGCNVWQGARGDCCVPFSGVGPAEPVGKAEKYPLPFTQHQTYSWRITGDYEYAYRERSQMRLVIDTVGKPLSGFASTKRLARAFLDAIKGHENAWKLGVLHRDISEGNVLLVDEDATPDALFTAFLGDFDYSWVAQGDTTPSTVDGRSPGMDDDVLMGQTGTPPFMAVAIHQQRTSRYLGRAIRHDVHHDLESFYWLLVRLVLRHTRCVHAWGPKAEKTLFGPHDHAFCSSMKAIWLGLPALAVRDNAPLTDLLRRFTDAVRANNPGLGGAGKEPAYLTHAQVIALFEEVVAREDWPEDDAAVVRGQEETCAEPCADPRPGEKRPRGELANSVEEKDAAENVNGADGPKRRRV